VSKQQIKLSKPEVLDEYNDFEVDHFARKEEMRGSRSVKDLKAKVRLLDKKMLISSMVCLRCFDCDVYYKEQEFLARLVSP